VVTSDILDRISPDEVGQPPGTRVWARIISVPSVPCAVLELRDRNSGQHPDPGTKPRHQYAIARGRLWQRTLPPAPLADTRDESPWHDDTSACAWRLVAPGAGIPWRWAAAQGVRPYPVEAVRVEGEWDLHGDGDCATVGYVMPAADPTDVWADVTGAACPADDCGQTLVWWEAGYVPGYRVCLARLGAETYDRDTIRHRWLWRDRVLVLDE